jgi:hypothetical protein
MHIEGVWTGWVLLHHRWQAVWRSPDRRACQRRVRAWAKALGVPAHLAVVTDGTQPIMPGKGQGRPAKTSGKRKAPQRPAWGGDAVQGRQGPRIKRPGAGGPASRRRRGGA